MDNMQGHLYSTEDGGDLYSTEDSDDSFSTEDGDDLYSTKDGDDLYCTKDRNELENVSFQLLEEFTDGFSEKRELGRGSFGVVYRGLTKNGDDVAVKKLHANVTDLNHKQFQNELYNLAKLQHVNIVRIYGYCYEIKKTFMEYGNRKVLVEEPHTALCLEYLHNGSLQDHISDEFSGLDWDTRYRIVKGVCRGLYHIHKNLEKPLYHLDLKPANILLNETMEPKLADFGLSRIFRNEELTRTTESPLGTLRYQPPEYIKRGEVSEKFDIFSLGVVMIHLVAGREGYERYACMHSEEFINQVKTNWRNRFQSQQPWRNLFQSYRSSRNRPLLPQSEIDKCPQLVIDKFLEIWCRNVETCARIALNCVEEETQKRPDIVMVINILDDDKFFRSKNTGDSSFWQDRLIYGSYMPYSNRYLNKFMSGSICDATKFDTSEEFIIGRKEEKKKIVASLLQSMTQHITILPIYGIGGIGKTTIAKLIYYDTNFSCYSRVWVSVSPRFDLKKVGNSVISQLSREESQINETQMLHSCLRKLLSGKKVLIVLDDLWEDNIFQLNNLKDMLSYGDSINVTVIVTTRSKHVAENVSTNVEPHKIEPLTDSMCWDIIKQRSNFEAKNHKEHLAHIGMEIAVKCGGVALAAQSLGLMLKPMELCDEWIEVRDSDIWNKSISKDANSPNHVLASLMLSCTKMDRHLMLCFTYCAIFPKGHHIVKEELIQQWISLGFIKPTKLHSIMQICEKYILQLIGLSFIQNTMSPKYSQAYKKGLTLFTMHDLVHDLARLLTAGEILDGSNIGAMDARHVDRESATSYQRRNKRKRYKYALLTNCHKPLWLLTDSPNTIRALHFRDCHGTKRLQDYAFLPAKWSLKVLDLSGCNIAYLPNSVGELAVLRYLNAPEVKNETLPDSLSKLSKLIYLNLSGSNISALPDSIGDIEGLMHLDISNCVLLSELPESFVDLKNLVYLDLSHCQIKITAKNFSGLTNIQQLNLSKILIHGGDRLDGLQEAIGGLTGLRYLNLSGCFENLRPEEILSFVDRICTLTYLVHLDLSFNLGLVRVPESIGNLRKLHSLDLLCCRNLVTLPKCMLNMDSMKILNVSCCPHLDQSTLPRYKYFTLPHFEVHAGDGESTSNIGLLRYVNPTYELYISGLDNTMSAEEVDSINLSQKQGIQSLSLSWTRDARRSVEDMDVLGKLVPPDTLKCFELRGYHGMSFPTWVMGITLYLPRLTKVVLWDLRKCNSLPPLGQLPTLQKLVMGGMDSTLTIEEGFCCAGPGAFPLLQEFQLCQMENLEVWNTTYSCGQNNDDEQQEFMFPNLRELLIRDCPKLRLKPCPPKTVRWKIENSDNVLSSWDEEGDIDLAALLPPRKKFEKLWEGKTKVPAACSAQSEKCRKPGASYNACPERVEVKSSKLPLEKWRLFRHLLPTYDLRISCCTYPTSGSSQEIIRGLSFVESLCLEDDAQFELPKWLGELTSLQTLEISRYPGLEAPLDVMKQLTHLRKLSLINCRSMSALPQWLGELISLKELIISEWPNLSDFPESMQHLTSLKMLRLERCPRITALPEWLGHLASLKILVISNCEGIVSLPESIQKLTRLVRV